MKPLPRPLSEGRPLWAIALDLAHTSATPLAAEVRAEAEVTDISGKIITFQITAFDEAGEIGRCTHQRALVNAQRFLEKAYDKL
ncbi:MAG: thioesterase family protein [Oscillospiraceae bacterium]